MGDCDAYESALQRFEPAVTTDRAWSELTAEERVRHAVWWLVKSLAHHADPDSDETTQEGNFCLSHAATILEHFDDALRAERAKGLREASRYCSDETTFEDGAVCRCAECERWGWAAEYFSSRADAIERGLDAAEGGDRG